MPKHDWTRRRTVPGLGEVAALEESLRHLRQRRADAEQQLRAANPGLIVS